MKKGSAMYEAYLAGRPTAYEEESEALQRWIPHGEEGHTGYRCADCTGTSANRNRTHPRHSADYWQDKEIEWNRKVNKIQTDADERILGHVRAGHPPGQRCGCDLSDPVFPPRPVPPVERFH